MNPQTWLKASAGYAAFAAGACALAILVYLPGLSGGFALDDYTNVSQNPAIAIHELSWASLSHAALSFEAGPAMRPLSMASFALNAYFTGTEDASYFKITNLLIHLVNGLLVACLLWRLLGAYREHHAPEIPPQRLHWLALLAAALWLVHPLNLTPVLYVVQRETALSSLFVLLGLNIYIWSRERQFGAGGRTWAIWLGIPFFTLAAVLCKESGALLPVYALVLELFLFRFHRRDGGLDRSITLFYLVFLVVPGCAGLAWALFGHHGAFLNYAGRDYGLRERLLSESRVVWLYIRWTLLPDVASLGLYHDDIAPSRGLLQPATTLFSIAGLVALLAASWLLRRRRPLVALGIAWFLAGQLMESSIFPLELAYEHRCYLPDLGLIIALLSLVYPLQARSHAVLVRYAALVCFIGLCAAMTWQRAHNWRDNLTFASTEALHHPESPYATYMLGQTYANLALMTDKNQYQNAVITLQAAAAVPNSTIIPDVSLVLVEAQLRGHVEPGVLARIADKLRNRKISASDIQGLEALGDCVDKANCVLPHADMQAIFEAALANPYLAELRETHANILVIYGNFIAYTGAQDIPKARELMGEAAALVPTEPQYQANLVTMDLNMGDKARAAKDLDGLRRLDYLGHLDSMIAGYEAQIGAPAHAP